jgi:hypothetical protein
MRGERFVWPFPRDAKEHVLLRHASGAKSRAEFRRRGEVVAVALWEPDGTPCQVWGLSGGKKHGPAVEWWANGRIAFVEHWKRGVLHGALRHYDDAGQLLLVTRFVRGTGVDLWCDLQNRTLSEETWLVGGRLRERRWWNPDERTVHREELYGGGGHDGGIERAWSERGRLLRGFPTYVVHGERVTKRRYAESAEEDPTLPRYRSNDDDPRRRLRVEYVGQPVHLEAKRRP